MPSKNVIKTYVKNGVYHIYNRGVEKRDIYKNTQDYKVFLKYLKEHLSPPPDKKALAIDFELRDKVFKGVPRLPKIYNK